MPARTKKGRPVDVGAARTLLSDAFELAESDHRDVAPVSVARDIVEATERLFLSETQAYRDALPSCVIARIVDPEIDIRLPATAYGEKAFSGRSLADKVVTPFLRDRSVPTSASPFLSALRGGAKFVRGSEPPRIQRDKAGFAALVDIVNYLHENNTETARNYLRYLLRRFIMLRESHNITLKRISKPNLEQLSRLIHGMLTVKSGGRVPPLLATAMFQTISQCHALGWEVEFQGINVADKASGAVGDITISKGGTVILGVEVTERSIDQARVTSTFNQKVGPSGLADYLFITTVSPEEGALAAARRYTGVGHEMNFVPLAEWLVHNLATVGPACRSMFQAKMIDLLSARGVPAEIRVAWNDKMDEAIGVKPSLPA
jgi:SacI-like restriction endonuclease